MSIVTQRIYTGDSIVYVGENGGGAVVGETHTLTLTKDGKSLGSYNPSSEDKTIDVPDDDSEIYTFLVNTAAGYVTAAEYAALTAAITDNKVVNLLTSSGATQRTWRLQRQNTGGLYFFSIAENLISSLFINATADSSTNHAVTVSQLSIAVDSYIKNATASPCGWLQDWATANHGGDFGTILGAVCGSGNNKHYTAAVDEEVDSCASVPCGFIVFLDFSNANKLASDESVNVSVKLSISLSTPLMAHSTAAAASAATPDELWVRVFGIYGPDASGMYDHRPFQCGAEYADGLLVRHDTIHLDKVTELQTDGSYVTTATANVVMSIIGEVVTFTYRERD